MQELWTAVDGYLAAALLPRDADLEAALAESAKAGLPAINVSPMQGKLLHLLARGVGAKRILEIGTLGGYSTIWLARALPREGRLISLEVDPHHAAVAKANIARAGLDGIAEVRLGKALDSLPAIAAETDAAALPPFDFVFIDADKANITEYFEWSLRLARRGAIIVVDNVVRKGAVIDEKSEDANVRGVRRFLERLANEPRATATTIQTVGSKGYDGFTLAVVTEASA
jgi:predicted O-methyltransferase YrrM